MENIMDELNDIPVKEDIEPALIELVASNQMGNLSKIMANLANSHFKTMQSKDKKPYEEMLADKEILLFYMNFTTYLKKKVESIEKRRAAEIAEKISRAQEEL
jgi:hypothetical protein